MRLIGLGLLWLTACFVEASGDDDDGSADGTDASSTTSTASASTTMSATVDEGSTSGMDTQPGTSASSSVGTTESSDSTGVGETESATSLDAEATSAPLPDVGSGNCFDLDFEMSAIECSDDDMQIMLGEDILTVSNAPSATGGPCIEDVADGDGWSAPMDGRYLWVQLAPNNGASLSFTDPVETLEFRIGGHHADGGEATMAICTSIAEPCKNPTAFADENATGDVVVDVMGATVVWIYMNDGTSNLAIDDIHVCLAD